HDEVRVRRRLAFAAEAVQPILDVGCVAWLRHLAVVDDVDAGGGLARDDLRDGVTDARRERAGLDGDALLLREHHADEIFRTRQASRMRRQKTIAAAWHGHDCGLWSV